MNAILSVDSFKFVSLGHKSLYLIYIHLKVIKFLMEFGNQGSKLKVLWFRFPWDILVLTSAGLKSLVPWPGDGLRQRCQEGGTLHFFANFFIFSIFQKIPSLLF